MTKEQFIEKYSGKATWCKTEKLAEEFLKEADSFGFKWLSGDKPTAYSDFNIYKYRTYYFADKTDFTIAYGDLGYVKNNGYEIIEYKPEEKQEEKPKNLIPLIAKELGVEIGEEFYIKKWSSYKHRFTNEQLEVYLDEWTEVDNETYRYIMLRCITIEKLPKAPRLSEQEYWVLKGLKDYKYLMRDNVGDMNVQKNVSVNIGDDWDYMCPYNHLFKFVEKDQKPHNIQELIKEYEELLEGGN